MSTKDKGKVDDTTSVISDNKSERVLTLTTTVVKVKKDILIKIRNLVIFIGNRIKFSTYKTSVGLAV
jgi:hypothetical protein